MACTAKSDFVVIETEPLQLNEETPSDTKPNHEDAEQVELSLLIENQQASQSKNNAVKSYAIDPTYHNTSENPYRETTVTLPHMVKKVPEDDLTPRPWKTFNQILVLSYVSVVFCLCFGVFANREAWKAKLYNGKGLYGLAQKRARRAALVSYIAVGSGLFLIILFLILGLTNYEF